MEHPEFVLFVDEIVNKHQKIMMKMHVRNHALLIRVLVRPSLTALLFSTSQLYVFFLMIKHILCMVVIWHKELIDNSVPGMRSLKELS